MLVKELFSVLFILENNSIFVSFHLTLIELLTTQLINLNQHPVLYFIRP